MGYPDLPRALFPDTRNAGAFVAFAGSSLTVKPAISLSSMRRLPKIRSSPTATSVRWFIQSETVKRFGSAR